MLQSDDKNAGSGCDGKSAETAFLPEVKWRQPDRAVCDGLEELGEMVF